MSRYSEDVVRAAGGRLCGPMDKCPMCNPQPLVAPVGFDWEDVTTMGERPEISS